MTFHTVSGDLRISLIQRKNLIETDLFVNAGKPIPVFDTRPIEYRWIFNQGGQPIWLPLPSPLRFSGKLLDSSLQPGHQWILQFRREGETQIIQQTAFSRKVYLPSIIGYRQYVSFDSIDSRIKSKVKTSDKEGWSGYEKMNSDSIRVLPGHYLELILKNHHFIHDSCVEYRLYKTDTDSHGKWLTSGHLLLLSSIESKNNYTLQLRYNGVEKARTYYIVVQPYWYQTPLAITGFLITGAICLLGVPYGIYRIYLKREKAQRTRVEEQIKTVQSQLNPHFVYNSLSSIEALVALKENDRANEYLNRFSELMRETMTNSNLLLTSLADDISMVENYIHIEQLRFEFRFVMQIDPALDLYAIDFPPMVLQPCLENAVKHGVSGLGPLGTIHLKFQKQGNDLLITVLDNGNIKNTTSKKGNGMGLKLTKERIYNLKKLYKNENIEFSLTSTEQGTMASFYFQNWI
jgi:hypothetical protein